MITFAAILGLLKIASSVIVAWEPPYIIVAGVKMAYHSYCDNLHIACKYCAPDFLVNAMCHMGFWFVIRAFVIKNVYHKLTATLFCALSFNAVVDAAAICNGRIANPNAVLGSEIGYSVLCVIWFIYSLFMTKKRPCNV